MGKVRKTEQNILGVKGERTRFGTPFFMNVCVDENIDFLNDQKLRIRKEDYGRETSELDGRDKKYEKEKRITREFLFKKYPALGICSKEMVNPKIQSIPNTKFRAPF